LSIQLFNRTVSKGSPLAGSEGRTLGLLDAGSLAFLRHHLDHLLSSQRFRDAATRFPLTRPIARRRARALFDLCAGFVYAQVLLALVRLRIPDRLLDRPLTVPELAAALSLPADRLERLLLAAVSLRLLSHRPHGAFGLGPLGAALVDNPGLVAMIEHHGSLYDDLRDPVALLRGPSVSSLGQYWPYAGGAAPSPEQAAPYTALMSASQPMIAAELLDAYPVRRHRHLLDVGGGGGAFLAEALARAPALRGTVFDLPPVAAIATTRFAALGLSGRADSVGGNFATDPLPSGADLVTLVRVLHDHDDPVALSLLRAIRVALPSGGVLVIAEPMSGTPGALPAGDAYFGVYLMAMGSGRPRRPQAIRSLLAEAGFKSSRLLRTRTPLLTRAIAARA
jgi:demethylspheroidene O-methyltransferase